MRSMTLVIFMTVASVLAAQIPAARPGNAAPSENAGNGKKIYVSYGCYQCHGYEGQGGGAGARLAPRPPLLFPAFAAYVRLPSGQMPPYTSKIVTDQELADIYAFLLTVPQPPPVSSIPQLSN